VLAVEALFGLGALPRLTDFSKLRRPSGRLPGSQLLVDNFKRNKETAQTAS